MKKILCLIALIFVAFALTSCDKAEESLNTNVPYGNLSDTTVYASLGNKTLSEKALYEILRADAYSLLTNEITKTLVNPSQLGLSVSKNQEEIDKLINKACYSTEDISNLNSETKATYAKKFVDTMKNLGLEATVDNIYSDDVRAYFLHTFANFEYAKNLVKNENSKYYYKNEYQMEDGKELLDSDNKKISNPYYVSDSDLESYYDSYIKDEQDVEVIILGFATVHDAQTKFAAAGANVLEDGSLDLNGKDALTVFKAVYASIYGTTPEDFTVNSDKLSQYTSSLIKLVNELKAGQYTSRVQQLNSINYFVYKLNDTNEVEYANYENKDRVLNEKLDSMITTSVAGQLIAEQIGKADIKVYDPLFSKLFKADHEDYTELTASEWKDEYANYVCRIGEKNLTVRDFFNVLENSLGPVTASGYFTELLLLEKHANLLTEDDLTEINNSIETTKTSFTEGKLTDYPSSLTLDEFNLLYYQATSSEGVANKQKVNKIWNYLLKVYPTNLFDKTEEQTKVDEETGVETTVTVVTEDGFMKRYAQQYYDNYFSLTINHILVSIDYDMDGSLDDPELLLAKLDSEVQNKFKADLTALMNAVLAEVDYIVNDKQYAELLDAMKFVVKQFTAGEDLLSDPTKNWNDYKTFNFALKVESLGNVSTSNASSYVKAFSLGVEKLYKELKEADKLSDKYIPTTVTYEDLIQTNYGYHVLSSTATSNLSSAAYSTNPEKTYEITWQEVTETLGANNENLYPSNNQIKIYMAQVEKDGSSTLTSTIRTCIEYFYNSFTSRYQDATFQDIYFAYNNILGDVVFTDSTNLTQLKAYYEVAKRSYDNYVDYSLEGNQALAGWWVDFGCAE